MKKVLIIVLAVLVAGIVFTGIASAEANYTSVSEIPMAVDFTFMLEFDDAGEPHIVTDYPFESTGATEMVLNYNTVGTLKAVELTYEFNTGETRVVIWNNRYSSFQAANQALRNGQLTVDDTICINTSNYGPETDWFLLYSLEGGRFFQYDEKTYAQPDNGIETGGTIKSASYDADGNLSHSSFMKRSRDADLWIIYDVNGEVTDCRIDPNYRKSSFYSYDKTTGLFNGKKLSELGLGFEDEDLQVPAIAALGREQVNADQAAATTETEPAETKHAAVTAEETPVSVGYISVSQIPMAVDFTVSVEFDDAGNPRVVTDYPFETTGATEMNLTYDKDDIRDAITVNYRADTGKTRIIGFNRKVFPDFDTSGAGDMIRNGVLTLHDSVYVGTKNENDQTDWYLAYSISEKTYVFYEEKTHSQGYKSMGVGGTAKTINYTNGIISESAIIKRMKNADMILNFDQFGNISKCSVAQYRPESKTYECDPATGLFDGKKISELELGFEEADLQATAPAALGKTPDKAEPAVVTTEAEQAEKETETIKTEQAKTEPAAVTSIGKPSIEELTSVTKIPMAVDFTVSVEFDDNGKPHIVTDYPFKTMGATEMNLQFSTKGFRYAIDLTYDAVRKETRFSAYNPNAFSNENALRGEASQMIRDGILTMEDGVWIGTTYENEQTDWYLKYSISKKKYITYVERTHSQGFNAMSAGGTEKTINYGNGTIIRSSIRKRMENADMVLNFDRNGNVQGGYISQYRPEYKNYEYDSVTGLFDGKEISELGLGFEETDPQMQAPAALKTEQEEAEKEPATVETEQVKTESAVVTVIEKPSIDEFTSVSKIPMAVDFTVSVEVDDEGMPHIVTDYPFKAMGATELGLQYNKKNSKHATELVYDAVRKETRMGWYNPKAFSSDNYTDRIAEVGQMIRDGVLTMDDNVWIGTTYGNEHTDWYLEYSISKKAYVLYEEKTQSNGFTAMAIGGKSATISYTNGKISGSSITKRLEKADLILTFDRYGKLLSGYITQRVVGGSAYDYNLATGLFGGKKIGELDWGFEETDLQIPAPAALKTEQEKAETEPAAVETEQAKADSAVPAAEEVPAADDGQETADPKLFRYKIKEDGTAEITSVKESITDGRIPATLDGYAVTSIGYQAFTNCNNLTEVIIPEGVKTLSQWTFSYCENLKNISLPDSIEEIGQPPILQCYNMLSISISPNHPIYAFSNRALINKKNMQMIMACGMGETYEVSWGITEILEDAFCSREVKKIILPDSVQKIGMCAFTGAANLKEVFIPEGVKEIQNQAFMGCDMLDTVTIPNSVYSIGNGVFDGCNNLKTVQISEDHPVYEVKDRVLIDKRTMTLVSVAGSIRGVYTVPEGIKIIGSAAFQGCFEMTEIIIPDSVTVIGFAAIPELYNIVCKAREGSCAEKYCKKNGITFEPIK